MKTLFSVVSVVAMLTMAVGCGGSSKDDGGNGTDTVKPAVTNYYNKGCAFVIAGENGSGVILLPVGEATIRTYGIEAAIEEYHPTCVILFEDWMQCMTKLTNCNDCTNASETFDGCTGGNYL